MKTLLIHTGDEPPAEVRHIVASGSTEVKEAGPAELSQPGASQADRVVVWRRGEIEVRAGHGQTAEGSTRLRWPDDEDKLRLFFQTGG